MPSPQHEAENLAARASRTQVIIERIRLVLGNSSHLTMLDYGCGAGDVGLGLSPFMKRTILVDNDREALAEVSDKLGIGSKIEVRLLDLSREIPADLKVDVIVSAMSWHHVHDLDALLQVLPIIAPGGRLFVADLDHDGGAYHADKPEFAWIAGFNRDELRLRMMGHGYQDITVEDLWQGTRWVNHQQVPVSLFFLTATVPIPAA